MALRAPAILVALALCACDVEPIATGSGGVDADHGLVALLSDYTSVQIALLSPEGNVLSESFLSSGSAPTSGLAFAFSGDTVLPSSPSPSGEVVLIDRFGTNVISWANPRTAEVRTQLAVGTGFESNPRDYLELSPSKAYVSRWGENSRAGTEPFDSGGNLLVIDPSAPAITGSIELPRVDDVPPRPSGLTLLGSTAIVVLQRISRDFQVTAESQLVAVDIATDRVAWTLPIAGLKGCGRATPSLSRERLVVACSGQIDMRGDLADPSGTAIVVFDASVQPPAEIRRFGHDVIGSSVQPEIALVGDELVLAKTQTALGGGASNRLFSLDLESGAVVVLRTASLDAEGEGKGLTYGGLYCSSTLTICLLADADRGALRRFWVAGDVSEIAEVTIGGAGLPPLQIGGY